MTDDQQPAPGAGSIGPQRVGAAAEQPAGRTGTRTARFAWVAVAVILVGAIALVTYALTDPTVTQRTAPLATAAPDVVSQLAKVPLAVFDSVGVTAPQTSLVAPTPVSGQPVLKVDGKPEVLYVGAEYCPFCAAERWPLIVALSRFGRFSELKDMQSAQLSVFPGTQTFSFVGSTYTSRYLAFTGVELYSDTVNSQGEFARIATLSPVETLAIGRYGPRSDPGTYPFVDIGNRMVTSTSAFSPAVLVKQSQAGIAGGLNQADSPVTQAVVASANQLTAGVCTVTGQQPASVCASKGVREAAVSLGMS